MRITILPETGELPQALDQALESRRATASGPHVVINVALQPPNSLLHDGHCWSRYPPKRLIELTHAAMRRAARADFLVHASYVMVGARADAKDAGSRLQPLIDAALEAEQIVLSSRRPACVLRLGYLYGPHSRDLLAYRRAFRVGRPYWSGPGTVRQRYLHSADAAAALLAAAAQRPVRRVLYATDNQAASFAAFMNHFAKLIGNPIPLRLPGLSRPLSRIVVNENHMQMTELATGAVAVTPRPRGFEPRFATYRSGLRAVVDEWSAR